MISAEQAGAILLGLPQVEAGTSVGNTEYRLKRKLFATLWAGMGCANLRVGKDEQVMLLATDSRVYTPPVTGIKTGWVRVSLQAVSEESFREAAWKAWRNAAPARMALEY